MSDILSVKPLTASAFSPFGDVIATDGHAPIVINQGQSERFDDLANLQLGAAEGKACLSIFATKPLVLPLLLHQMECHHLGSQAFIPLSGQPWLVVVAPKGKFDRKQVRAFLASGKQGVNFAPGTWHHFSLALEPQSNFLVIDRKSQAIDCEEVEINPPLCLERLP